MLKRMVLLTIAATTMLAPVAMAGHHDARYRSTDRIVVLSDNLVDAARQMRLSAEQRMRGHHGQSRELLITLDRLERQARQFRNDAARDAGPRYLDARFDDLLVAFNRADGRMQLVRNGRLQRDFERVAQAMRALAGDVEAFRGPAPRTPGPAPRTRDDGLHGAIVLGDRNGDTRYQITIHF